MVDVRGDVLRPPHDTTPAAVKLNKNQKQVHVYVVLGFWAWGVQGCRKNGDCYSHIWQVDKKIWRLGFQRLQRVEKR